MPCIITNGAIIVMAWAFVDSDELSVKQELMPKQTAESLHYHKKAQQFFFILKGIATFEVEVQAFYGQTKMKDFIFRQARDIAF